MIETNSEMPRFVWNKEERKKNLYVVSFFSSIFPLINFLLFQVTWRNLFDGPPQDEGNYGSLPRNNRQQCCRHCPSLYFNDSQDRPRRTPEPPREWTFTESSRSRRLLRSPTFSITKSLLNVTSSSSILAEELSMYPFWLVLRRGFSK